MYCSIITMGSIFAVMSGFHFHSVVPSLSCCFKFVLLFQVCPVVSRLSCCFTFVQLFQICPVVPRLSYFSTDVLRVECSWVQTHTESKMHTQNFNINHHFKSFRQCYDFKRGVGFIVLQDFIRQINNIL